MSSVAAPARQIASFALLALAGAGLLSAQYVLARELGSTFFVTELSFIAATVVTLVGPSLGYALGGRLHPASRWLQAWAAAATLLHLSVPFGVRALVGLVGPERTGLAAILIAVAAAVLCGYYAVLLPLRARGPSLRQLYAAELGGAVAALLLLAGAPSWRLFLLAYMAIPAAVQYLANGRVWAVAAAGLSAAAWLAYPALDQAAARRYYVSHYGHTAPRIVETAYSPYQRIDVVAEGDAPELYLDGVPFYRSGDLDSFDEFLAEVPGALHKNRGRALVIGSGSFSSAARLHRLGYQVTVVELDAMVAAVGRRRFAAVHRLAPDAVSLVIDDGRRALSRSTARYEVIALDVPAPYRIQTALLHTPAFYRQVAAHLMPGGVVALSLCDGADGAIGRRIAAAAQLAFAEVMVVESASVGLAILYGSDRLPFALEEVVQALTARDPQGGRVLADRAVRLQTLGAVPISEKDLFGVLLLSRRAHSSR